MATPVFCCGFECGANVHWFPTGSCSISTATVKNGARAGRVNPTGGQAWLQPNANLGARNNTVFRVYFYVASAPTGDASIVGVYDGVTFGGIVYKSSDGKLYCGTDSGAGVNTFGATGVTFTTGAWYYADISISHNVNPWVIDAKIDGVSLGQATPAISANNAPGLMLGFWSTETADIYFDDVIVSATAADYPFGAGKVLGFVPSSDGTHTSTSTNIVKGTTGTPVGTAITSATADSFNWVNARPIGGGATDATRLINQQTASSAQYVEHGIEQTSEANAPRAVEVLCATRQAGTQSCNSTFKVNDNGTEDTVFAQSGNGATSDTFATKQYATMPNGGTAWTLARFKALKLRFGYSSDATPDVYLRGWMVEAEFAVATTPNPIPPRSMRVQRDDSRTIHNRNI